MIASAYITPKGYADGANNLVGMQDEFSNLEQATLEDQVAVTNLKYVNTTLTDQVALYTNHLSSKDAENSTLQREVLNLQGENKTHEHENESIKGYRFTGGSGVNYNSMGEIYKKIMQKGKQATPKLVESPLLLDTRHRCP